MQALGSVIGSIPPSAIGAGVAAAIIFTPSIAGEGSDIIPSIYEQSQINWAKQEKHFPGHPNFEPGRSELTVDPEKLLNKAGTGQQLDPGKERVDFGENIGRNVDLTGKASDTTVGIIHSGKNGSHIVPARPIP
jgi:hypothetical protein